LNCQLIQINRGGVFSVSTLLVCKQGREVLVQIVFCIYERVIPGTDSPETIGSLFKAAAGIYRIFYPMTAGFCARG
jgi:hypothetical protein